MTASYDALYLFIDGEWIAADQRKTEPVINPVTGETIGQVPHATSADLDRALDAAQAAFKKWKRTPAIERSKVLNRAADLIRERVDAIAVQLTLEQGKVLAESKMEIISAADTLEWYAEECKRAYGRVIPARVQGTRQLVVKEAVGPVAAFSPWNFPALTPARKMGGALAAGCSCILKAAEEVPGTAIALARALDDAGLPKGVLNLVFGVPAEVSRQLIASPIIRKVTFTGSTAVGKTLGRLAADGVKRVTLELGGHAPVIVFDDADIEKTAKMLIGGKFRNAGQVCISPTRFYVQEGAYKRFVEVFTQHAQALKLGDGLAAGTQMGPMANPRRTAAMESLVGNAVAAGAKIETGGERGAGKGFFWQPTVLSSVPVHAQIMNDEPFGAVAIINPFSSFDEVVEEANRVPYGLAAYAFTTSARTMMDIGDELESGMVAINSLAVSTPESPFGGWKESGYGSESGSEGLDAFLSTKFISQS